MAFIQPPPFGQAGNYTDLQSFTIGDPITLEWSDAPASPGLLLLNDDNNYTCDKGGLFLANLWCEFILPLFDNSTTSYIWSVSTLNYSDYNADFADTITFYLAMTSTSEADSNFDSHYFNIYPKGFLDGSSPSTTSTSSSTTVSSPPTVSPPPTVSSPPTGSASTTTSGHTPATTTPAAASGSTSPSSSGLSSSAKTAIGVSVGIGVPLLVILSVIAWLLYRKSKRRNQRTDLNTNPVMTPDASRYSDTPIFLNKYEAAQAQSSNWGSGKSNQISELNGVSEQRPAYQQQPSELSAENR